MKAYHIELGPFASQQAGLLRVRVGHQDIEAELQDGASPVKADLQSGNRHVRFAVPKRQQSIAIC